MEEVWKDIYFVEDGIIWDYRGLYQVSNLGRIKSLNYNRTKEERILKQAKTNKGYFEICLCKNGKPKKNLIHRLVGHMFVKGYFDGADIDHINTIRNDNRAENLRWVTSKENSNNPLSKENHLKAINEIHRNGKNNPNLGTLIERWNKNGELIDIKYRFEYIENGFNGACISECCKGKRKTHKGYIFKYHKGLEN